jgi:CarD family transcriptional regulator
MAEAAFLSLSAGDRVVYPNQGVCRVTGIEEKEIAGQKLEFISMRREQDGALVMVPRPKLLSIGVRKVSGPEDVKAIFDFLKADTEKTDLDWKQRARANLDRMSTGGLMGLAEVVKGLQILSELRPLPTKERELYDNARHLLVSEIAAATSVDECTAEDSVDVALFPPGKERPKRTAEEFRPQAAGDDEDLDLPDELLGLGADVELAEEPAEEAEPAEEPFRARLSDEDVTMPMGTALVPDEALPPRRRGRPPKPKLAAPEPEKAAPKKRGRPPKPKPAPVEAAAPKKRGRPPKAEKTVTKKKKK